ncbi:MAG: 50S ribosomal protein L4 [Actinomycetota bacterium]|nr:50S ribosomal protein L4 [Actinomycetota bacterium]
MTATSLDAGPQSGGVQGEALSLPVRTAGAEGGRTVDVPAAVFDVQVNVPLIHQVVVAQLAAARQGTHKTKTRGEVSGGGKKPYRQKGTGRARQGSIRAPQFTGGGIVHGPVPRDYAQRTPKKMKAAALRGALSDRFRHGRVFVVDRIVEGDAPSTRAAVALLAGLTTRPNVLVVAERDDLLTWKSLRNAPNVHLLAPGQLNTYDVLVSDDVVFTEDALQAFLRQAAGTRSARANAVLRGDLPGSAGGSTGDVAGAAARDVDQGGTPGEDLTPHLLDSDVPSIAPATSADAAGPDAGTSDTGGSA